MWEISVPGDILHAAIFSCLFLQECFLPFLQTKLFAFCSMKIATGMFCCKNWTRCRSHGGKQAITVIHPQVSFEFIGVSDWKLSQ